MLPPPRNIVICCDGTSNEFVGDKTNVVKFYQTLVQTPQQITYYHPGLGTMEAVGAVTSVGRWVTRTLGLAIGYGLEADIRDAYVFLMRTYEPGDRVFLFGFSRGAYTVRALASLLRLHGLMRPSNEALTPYAIRMMMAMSKRQPVTGSGNEQKDDTRKRAAGNPFRTAAEFKATFGTPCKPHFVGVWDTVSSVGWFHNPRSLPYTGLNTDINVGRHAVAIDESRGFFRQNLWSDGNEAGETGPKDLKQLWFAGSHGDVGGGYPEEESHLSKVSLGWMAQEARSHGIEVDQQRLDRILGKTDKHYSPPDPNAPIHNSLVPKWWLAEFVPKRRFNRDERGEYKEGWGANLFRPRRLPKDAKVHVSAYARDADYVKKLPPGPGFT